MVRSRRSTPAKKVEDAKNTADQETSASDDVVSSIPGGKSSSKRTTTMESPASSVASSPDGNKDIPNRCNDYEAFRREKNKQAARDFRDRQKKAMADLSNRVRLLQKEKNALSARLLRRETEVQLYEQQIADYRDLLLLYSTKYGTEGLVVSPQVKPVGPSSLSSPQHQQQQMLLPPIKEEESSLLQPAQLAAFEVCV